MQLLDHGIGLGVLFRLKPGVKVLTGPGLAETLTLARFDHVPGREDVWQDEVQ